MPGAGECRPQRLKVGTHGLHLPATAQTNCQAFPGVENVISSGGHGVAVGNKAYKRMAATLASTAFQASCKKHLLPAYCRLGKPASRDRLAGNCSTTHSLPAPMKTILFDLDGTLLDHFRAIHLAIAHAQRQLGLPESSYDTVRQTVGGGVALTLERLIGADQVAPALPHYNQHFETIMLDHAEMLPGAVWLLEALKADGRQLAVFSNKSGAHSRAVLRHFELDSLLDAIIGTGDTPIGNPRRNFPGMSCKYSAQARTTPC